MAALPTMRIALPDYIENHIRDLGREKYDFDYGSFQHAVS